jgi:hypothetical protein
MFSCGVRAIVNSDREAPSEWAIIGPLPTDSERGLNLPTILDAQLIEPHVPTSLLTRVWLTRRMSVIRSRQRHEYLSWPFRATLGITSGYSPV